MFHIPGRGDLPVTLIDCANPVVLFKAADVGLTGTELTSLNTQKDFIELVGRVRGMAAQVFGLVDRWEDAATKSTYMPFVGIVSPPQSYEDMDGNRIEAEEMDICCRSFITRLHRAYPIAASMATAAAARIPGTVVYEVVRKGNAFRADSGAACGKAQGAAADDRNVSRPIGAGNGVVLGHAGGCTEVQMEVDGDEVIRGTVLRTANTIMRGTLWVDEV